MVDFVLGWCYVLDVIVNLRVGYVIVHNLSRTVELDWKKLGGRVALWRDLIADDVEKDPFLGDREMFLRRALE